MRTTGGVIALAREGAINLPDPRSVGRLEVHNHPVIRETKIEGLEAPFKEIAVGIIVWQVHSVKQVCAVP